MLIRYEKNLDKLFPDNSLVVCPDVLKSDLPEGGLEGLPYKQKVHCFKNNYKLWIFDYAELFVNACNEYAIVKIKSDYPNQDKGLITTNSGFAILSVLNPYFEIIGKLCGDFPHFPFTLPKNSDDCRSLSPEDFIKEGITLVLNDMVTLSRRKKREIINKLYGPIRNSVAHSGLTGKGVILSLDHNEMIVCGEYKGKFTIVINPHRWYEYLRGHFDKYVEILEDSNSSNQQQKELQTKFDERFHTLR